MQLVKVYLKCGNVVQCECEDFEVNRSSDGHMKGLSWKNTGYKDQMVYIKVDEVVAITYSILEYDDEDLPPANESAVSA